jgi:rRNA maturation endonuclease Nob1
MHLSFRCRECESVFPVHLAALKERPMCPTCSGRFTVLAMEEDPRRMTQAAKSIEFPSERHKKSPDVAG